MLLNLVLSTHNKPSEQSWGSDIVHKITFWLIISSDKITEVHT